MARPTSFRLPEELLESLNEEAGSSGTSVTSLVTMLLDEGVKTRRFPGVAYRDGPTGRRAALIGGPDVWEIVREIAAAGGRGEERLRIVADIASLSLDEVRLAVDFYAANADEIDHRIDLDEQESERIRRLIERREQLLSP